MDPILSAVIGGLVLIFLIVGIMQIRPKPATPPETPKAAPEPQPQPTKPKKPKVTEKKKEKRPDHTHARFKGSLKHHNKEVVQAAFSACGRYFASASEDQTLRIYPADSLVNGSHGQHKRVAIEADYPVKFCFSSNGNYILLLTQMHQNLNIYAIGKKDPKKPGSSGINLTKQISLKQYHQTLVSVDFSANLKYIATCSTEDTKVCLFDVHGNHLAHFTTMQMRNHWAKFTPDSRFLGVATYTTGLSLYEVVEDKKSGSFKSLEKAIFFSSSKGHKKGIRSLDFTSDSKKMVTGSLDGQWKLWNIVVDYKREEEAQCLKTGATDSCKEILHLSISPDNSKLVCASENALYLWKLDGTLVDTIQEPHAREITSVHWSTDSKLISSSSSDGQIRIWDGEY